MDDRHPAPTPVPIAVPTPPPSASDGVLDDLRSFLAAALPGADLGVDDDYFEQGNANSLFALELVTFVERNFSVVVEVDDLDLDNFRTLGRTAEFVRAKRAATATTAVAPDRAGGSAGGSVDGSVEGSTGGSVDGFADG